MLREQFGDLWEIGADADAIVITTNGVLDHSGRAVMGAGVAKEARQRYPGLPYVLGQYLKLKGNHCHILKHDKPALVSYPTKDQWRAPAKTHLIYRSAVELYQLADAYGWEKIVVPRPGCGHGGLSWANTVRPLIVRVLDDRFIIVSTVPILAGLASTPVP